MEKRHQIVVLGGGFGGLRAVHTLARAPADITLIDRRNFHLFQPLLYQVAIGGLSPANICAPLRGALRKQKNARVLLAEAKDVDVAGRRVLLEDGEVSYDTLIVATGSGHSYFGHDDWARFAPALKTIEDATEIRRRILLAFEAAERETDPAKEKAWLTFVIVGAGATGVELAGALSEIANDTLRHDFRRIDPSQSRIMLVEASDRVLPPYPPDLSARAAEALRRLKVTIRTGATVIGVSDDSVTLKAASGTETIPAHSAVGRRRAGVPFGKSAGCGNRSGDGSIR